MRPNPADVFTLVLEKIYRRPPIPMGENDPETFVGQLARRYRSPLHGYRFELRTTHVRLMIESLNSSLHEIYIQIRGDIVLFERCLKSIFFFFLRRIPSSNRFFVFLFFWIESDGSNTFRTVFTDERRFLCIQKWKMGLGGV